jgi:glycosyltransferase involved in cell wall biosynthesis
MKISIVTISFNQAPYLKQCIDSVLSQKGVDLDYVVVDPGSTDGSRELIESYGDAINKVFEKDMGPADGLNKGFRNAVGDIFGFINSDDYLNPNALLHVKNAFTELSDVGIVSGRGSVVDANGRFVRAVSPSVFEAVPYVYGACTVLQQSTFFRRSYYELVGGFNLKNKTCWDGELFLDMALAGAKSAVLQADLAAFRIYPESISGSGRLLAEYALDCDRLFQKTVGRPRKPVDAAFTAAYMARKHALRMLGL